MYSIENAGQDASVADFSQEAHFYLWLTACSRACGSSMRMRRGRRGGDHHLMSLCSPQPPSYFWFLEKQNLEFFWRGKSFSSWFWKNLEPSASKKTQFGKTG